MTPTKTLRALTLALSGACLALAVWAQTADMSEGEIRKVDQEGGQDHISPRRNQKPGHAAHDHGVHR